MTAAEPFFRMMGKRIHFCGGPGNGQAAKVGGGMLGTHVHILQPHTAAATSALRHSTARLCAVVSQSSSIKHFQFRCLDARDTLEPAGAGGVDTCSD